MTGAICRTTFLPRPSEPTPSFCTMGVLAGAAPTVRPRCSCSKHLGKDSALEKGNCAASSVWPSGHQPAGGVLRRQVGLKCLAGTPIGRTGRAPDVYSNAWAGAVTVDELERRPTRCAAVQSSL